MFKYEVRNRFSGEVQFVAELDRDHGSRALNLGAAVKWAIKNGANLGGANLRGADLRDAYLRGANLGGAYLRGAKGIIRIGPSSDGYEFFGIIRDDILWVKAGCRWFTAKDAKKHWKATRGGTALGDQRLMFVRWLEQWAKTQKVETNETD